MSNNAGLSKFSELGFMSRVNHNGARRELLEEGKRERAVRALDLASKPGHAHTTPALLIRKIDAIFNEQQATLDGRLSFHEFSRACRRIHELSADPSNSFFSTGPSSLAAGQLSDALLQDLFWQHVLLDVATHSGWIFKR